MGEPAPRASAPGADVMEYRDAHAALGDGLPDSNPLPPALLAALSPPRQQDESMSGGEPNTPAPKRISSDHPDPIVSSESDDGGPLAEETEMRTLGVSTSVRMEEGYFGRTGTTQFVDRENASDVADLSDTGDAPASVVRFSSFCCE
jgi:hypothetical protein